MMKRTFRDCMQAEQVGMDADQVFKTLVTRGDKTGILVFCIPVDMELDLKKAASVSKNKKVEMTHMKELLGLTGLYPAAGCSPIGMKKNTPPLLMKPVSSLMKSRSAQGCAANR